MRERVNFARVPSNGCITHVYMYGKPDDNWQTLPAVMKSGHTWKRKLPWSGQVGMCGSGIKNRIRKIVIVHKVDHNQ